MTKDKQVSFQISTSMKCSVCDNPVWVSTDNKKVEPCGYCMGRLIAEMTEKINLCNYCGQNKKKDLFCSDECAEKAAAETAEHEWERLFLHG